MSDKAKTAGEKAKKKGSKMPIIIGFVLLILINALVLGKVMLGGGKGGSKSKDHKEKSEEEIGAKVTLDEFLVNLSGGEGHYLKTSIAIGVAKGLTEEKIKEEIAPIRDAVIAVLCNKKLEELDSEKGKEKLKEEIKEKINKELGEKKVVKVYFTEFATQ